MERLESEQAAPHELAIHEAVLLLETDPRHGLDGEEAARRLDGIGPNRLPAARRPGPVRRFLSQLRNPLILVLVAASAVTFAINEPLDGGVIGGVVLAIAIIGFIQESRAEHALEALRRMVRRTATVIRDGEAISIASGRVVPGDLLVIRAGDMIAADARLIESRELEIDESVLTGESVPVAKSTEPLPGETGVSDRVNLAFSGTLATRGEGRGVVVATGAETEIGLIHRLIGEAGDVSTPLTRKIGRFGRHLTVAILAAAIATYLIGLARGEDPVDLFLAAVALAVAAIPEGLPATITVALAIGVRWMAQRNAIVRRMPAVEALGSTTVICSDKTGTLTENRMTVEAAFAGGRRFTVSGSGYGDMADLDLSLSGEALPEAEACLQALLEAGVLCSDASLEGGEMGEPAGDPTELALVAAARRLGFDPADMRRACARLDVVPFESERRFMATLNRDPDGGEATLYVKGATERVVEMCSRQLGRDGREEPLDRRQVMADASELSGRGFRVLAFARGGDPSGDGRLDRGRDPEGLTFIGLQAMLDPPRKEAVDAVAACRAAGIEVKMVTGDHAGTALAIARQIGLAGEGDDAASLVMTGSEIAELDLEGIARRAGEAAVFARVSAEQKLRLVRALQGAGEVVAMTGDGVNDAPALKRADIGVAMGMTGTEVAREASDMVLADDNFASIEAAVREGRRIFDNLTKFIVFVLPTNLGEGLLVVAAIVAGLSLPMLPVQILWVNLATAVLLGMPLAFERAEPDIMTRPPRDPEGPIVGSVLIMRMGLVGIMLLVGAFALYEWARSSGAGIAEARTIAVNVFIAGEAFYLLNCRSLRGSIREIGWTTNRWAAGGIAAILALQLLFTYAAPMNTLFDSAPIDLHWWAAILAVGAIIWGTVGLEKWIRRAGARGRAPA